MESLHNGASDPNLRRRRVVEVIKTTTEGGLPIEIHREEAWLDKEWELQNFFAYNEGELIGYLRTITYDEGVYELSIPTVYDYIRKKMRYPKVKGAEDLNSLKDGKAILEKALLRYSNDKKKCGTPYIDYSYVADGQDEMFPKASRGLGVGTQLYVEVAKALGREGKLFRGSDTFSPEADEVWQSLQEKGYPVVPAVTPFGRGLDYTHLYEKAKQSKRRGL